MNNVADIKCLLIDVDGTLVDLKQNHADRRKKGYNAYSLFDVLLHAGPELGRLSCRKTGNLLDKVTDAGRWWLWEDFIDALGLDHREFWDYAFNYESQYLTVTGEEVIPALQQFNQAGISLYIVSNNPISGTKHKLRLAGLPDDAADNIFSGYFGAHEFKCMKWERKYWLQVIEQLGMDVSQFAVIGDNFCDDYEIPFSVEIPLSFIINRYQNLSDKNSESVIFVNNFTQISDLIL